MEIVPVQVAFLLIDSLQESYWRRVLEEVLATMGTLEIATEEEAILLVLQRRYDIIIVDATAVNDVPLCISRIRAQQQETKIVVATASPTWRRAREAFQAGAADYIRKSSNKEELLSSFRAILGKASRTNCNQLGRGQDGKSNHRLC